FMKRFDLSVRDHFNRLPIEIVVVRIACSIVAEDGGVNRLSVQVGIGDKIGPGRWRSPTVVVGVIDHHISFFSCPGGNEDYAEGTACTIDSSRRRVFKHGYAFHIIGVHAGNVTLDTIDKDEGASAVD